MIPDTDAALVIAGHGSTLNPDSSAPTHQHADEIRRRGIFAEVGCAFWKEEPSMREVFYQTTKPLVYVVPNFISEGYFCQEVLPRELRLTGPVTVREGVTYAYCDPVGIHPSMTRLLLARAEEVAPGVPRDQTCLIIVGHGTSLNENSRKAIEDQVKLIRDGGYGFAEVLDAYMEEEPLVAKWHELSTAPHVVVVPFFIADGLHSYQDIPVLLGMESEPTAALSQSEVFRHNPHALHGRSLYYSSAIGTEALMAEVILDQVKDFKAKHGSTLEAASGRSSPPPALPRVPFKIGQVSVSPAEEGTGWILSHVDDLGAVDLKIHTNPIEARTLSIYDDAGQFRPLKTAPTLRHGWKLVLEDDATLRLALDFLYPAALGLSRHHAAGTLEPVSLRQTLGRQTGMYRFSNKITDEQAQEMVACHCDAETKCIRRITWQLNLEQPLTLIEGNKRPDTVPAGEIPLLCVEACTHIVSAAREIARGGSVAGAHAHGHNHSH
ncbi:CbiX/SirB N-terminal domain-containing protein [Verrucomicrobium spinosum]|uniref:CbiX/SirB N-terminal domain-containing protein n=1 Tax=Verrucomicrobium spinosum TaxID=2736 RepID=UPI0001744E84|nr:CbiX/SirB N-terminal domain-containing protein [Verrucomicrobium spinosum]